MVANTKLSPQGFRYPHALRSPVEVQRIPRHAVLSTTEETTMRANCQYSITLPDRTSTDMTRMCVLALTILLSLVPLSVVAKPPKVAPPPTPAKPDYDTALGWILQKSADFGHRDGGGFSTAGKKWQYFMDQNLSSESRCKIRAVVTDTLYYDDSSRSSITVTTCTLNMAEVNINQFSYTRMKDKDRDDGVTVFFHSPVACKSTKKLNEDAEKVVPHEDYNRFSLLFNQKDLPERAMAALRDLAVACGASTAPEPY